MAEWTNADDLKSSKPLRVSGVRIPLPQLGVRVKTRTFINKCGPKKGVFMHYIVYKTTNQINGKFYIGTHKTEDLNDNYMGSGKYLNHAIKKYGVENFKKEIMFVFDNPEQMFAKEAEIVTVDFLSEENTYNIKLGGFGGWGPFAREAREIKYPNGTMFGRKLSDISKKKISAAKIGNKNWLGRKHTEETKKKIGDITSKTQNGSKNSQFGTMWITNGKENRKISKYDRIPKDWYKGRKIKI